MTCIVGFVEKGKIWMGSDSLCVTDDFDQQVLLDDKVFIKRIMGLGSVIYGFAGFYRYGQALQYSFRPPIFKKEEYGDVETYIKTAYMSALRKHFEGANIDECECLIGAQGRLFHLEDDFSVTSPFLGYDTCGNSGAYALGAISALIPFTHLTGEQIIRKSLEAATVHSAACKPPFRILSIEGSWEGVS